MKIEHIVLAGDSAGAHLATCVTMLAILRGFRKPDGLLIHYPVFSINSKFFPSSLLSFDDELLSTSFLKFALGCFTNNGGNEEECPLLSPMVACDALLNRLPNMIIFASQCDVLRD